MAQARAALDAIKTERIAILAELDALETKRQREAMMPADRNRVDVLKARKQHLADESFRLQILLRAPRSTPRAQYWDDDAPGGVVCE